MMDGRGVWLAMCDDAITCWMGDGGTGLLSAREEQLTVNAALRCEEADVGEQDTESSAKRGYGGDAAEERGLAEVFSLQRQVPVVVVSLSLSRSLRSAATERQPRAHVLPCWRAIGETQTKDSINKVSAPATRRPHCPPPPSPPVYSIAHPKLSTATHSPRNVFLLR